MANIDVFYSKKSDDWKTPSKLYEAFIKRGFIDPCPYKSLKDGLTYNFYNTRLFINPPFSKMSIWVEWAINQYYNNCDIVFLIPARTDTKYFHKLLNYNPEIYFIKGRLHYNDSEKNAPFPSLLIVLKRQILNKYENYYHSIDFENIINLIKEEDLL